MDRFTNWDLCLLKLRISGSAACTEQLEAHRITCKTSKPHPRVRQRSATTSRLPRCATQDSSRPKSKLCMMPSYNLGLRLEAHTHLLHQQLCHGCMYDLFSGHQPGGQAFETRPRGRLCSRGRTLKVNRVAVAQVSCSTISAATPRALS